MSVITSKIINISALRLQRAQTPITIYILKAYDEIYSKIIREHKDKDKDEDKVPETLNICYIFTRVYKWHWTIYLSMSVHHRQGPHLTLKNSKWVGEPD